VFFFFLVLFCFDCGFNYITKEMCVCLYFSYPIQMSVSLLHILIEVLKVFLSFATKFHSSHFKWHKLLIYPMFI